MKKHVTPFLPNCILFNLSALIADIMYIALSILSSLKWAIKIWYYF